MSASPDPAAIAAEELADVFAGSRWPSEGERLLAFTRDAVRHGEALRRRTGAGFGVELARFTARELDALAARIESDEDLLDAEGIQVLGAVALGNRVRMEVVTRSPAETLAWLYERYGDALAVEVVGADPYEERLARATGYRVAGRDIELRHARAGQLVRVEVVEEGDVVAAGIVERVRLGQRASVYGEGWAPAGLRAPLGARRVRDAASGRELPAV